MESCGAEKEFGVLVDAGERGSARCPCCKRVLVSWVWGQSQARSRGAQGQDERQRAQTEAQEVPSEHWEAPVGCAGCPERSWSLHPQRYPKAACETCSGRPCLSGGLDQVTPRGPCHPQPLGDCDSPQSWAAFALLPLAWAHPTPAPGAASQTGVILWLLGTEILPPSHCWSCSLTAQVTLAARAEHRRRLCHGPGLAVGSAKGPRGCWQPRNAPLNAWAQEE